MCSYNLNFLFCKLKFLLQSHWTAWVPRILLCKCQLWQDSRQEYSKQYAVCKFLHDVSTTISDLAFDENRISSKVLHIMILLLCAFIMNQEKSRQPVPERVGIYGTE